jgi:hypothetical protein
MLEDVDLGEIAKEMKKVNDLFYKNFGYKLYTVPCSLSDPEYDIILDIQTRLSNLHDELKDEGY